MSMGRGVIVGTVDQDDLLSVDGFDDLPPVGLDADASDSLEVDELNALLPARTVVVETFAPSDDTALEAGMASDYFSDGVKVRRADAAADDLFFLSETRRAALEFERFAEEFHAFARECLKR